MTVQTTTSRADYTGNGITTAFTVPFYFLDNTHITVLRTQISTGVITTLTLTTDYTVTGAGVSAGGTVTMISAPTTDQKVSILRNVPLTQLVHYVPNDPFPAATHEQALDQLTMETQQLNEAVSRALVLPANTPSGTVSSSLPTPSASKLIGWNSTGTGLQNVDQASLVTSVAYGTANGDIFSGNGVQTAFVLTANPGALNNLDIAISGVTQRPGIDYTWTSGTTVTFTSAPPAGTNNILIRYMQALALSNGAASSTSYVPSGAGAVTRSVQDKLREYVSVKDFGAVGDGVTNDTAAFTAAQAASDRIIIPPGTYLLDEFKQQNRKVFTGGGLNNTFIKQANAGRPAWWVVSKAGVYTTQIIGAQLKGVWFLGAGASATVASMIVEAEAPYTVQYCDFEIGGSGGYHTLEVISATANPVYSNRFSVIQQDPDNRSGGIGSYNTGVVCGSGVYNEWYLNIVGCQNGIAMTDSSFNCLFHHVITDGQQSYQGQSNVIVDATVEAWTGTARTGAIEAVGYNNRFISITLTNVPNTSVSGYGVVLNNASATITTILGYKIYGAYPGGAPLRPIQVGSSNSGFIADAEVSATTQKLEAYCTYNQLKNFTFGGDCSSLTALSKKFSASPVFVTASTYTVDSNFATTGQLDETIYLNSSANCTITLPAPSSFVGRKLYFCTRVAFTLVSASTNVLPMTGGNTSNILAATVGKWATLQSDGTNWNIIANN